MFFGTFRTWGMRGSLRAFTGTNEQTYCVDPGAPVHVVKLTPDVDRRDRLSKPVGWYKRRRPITWQAPRRTSSLFMTGYADTARTSARVGRKVSNG